MALGSIKDSNQSKKSDEGEEYERRKSITGLFKNQEDKYGNKYKDHLLEQYKLYVQMADKISERRSTANSFFLSLNGFLLAVLGALPYLRSNTSGFDYVWLIVVAAAGITFCSTWITVIKSYRKLNEAKFTIIGELEQKLPVATYDIEWEYLTSADKKMESAPHSARYFPLTLVEARVPVICIILYVAIIIGAFVFNLRSN
jgi:hypothetical protein